MRCKSFSSTIAQTEITKARITFCYTLLRTTAGVSGRAQFDAENACSNTTAELHEYFDHTGTRGGFKFHCLVFVL